MTYTQAKKLVREMLDRDANTEDTFEGVLGHRYRTALHIAEAALERAARPTPPQKPARTRRGSR